jgi:hypothetical protein
VRQRGPVLAVDLQDGLPLLVARRRTVTPRHQTMRAVVDPSYGLLMVAEMLSATPSATLMVLLMTFLMVSPLYRPLVTHPRSRVARQHGIEDTCAA